MSTEGGRERTRGQAKSVSPCAAAALLAALLALACTGPHDNAQNGTPDTDAATQRGVLTGIDVLIRERAGLLAGKRVGLITNHTGRATDGRSSIDALAALPNTRLVALFSPEHGLRGMTQGGARVASGRDSITGLPVRSLYGETRKPTPEMLGDIDVLVFDIQDIGARYYTYVSTMWLAMQAAAESGKTFVVLDRPNPIGGARVDGNVLEPEFASFVGLYPVPMRHGMTAGELAQWANTEQRIGADLTVVPMTGWQRTMWFDQTELRWLPTSPNMPDLESAAHYPGTCLFEGTNLSVGRGTAEAFRQIGAPWLDAQALARRLNAHGMRGVTIEPVEFTPRRPDDHKYDGIMLAGIRFTVTNRATYDPTITAVTALVEIRALHPDSLRFQNAAFDRLAGTDRIRLAVLRGATAAAIAAEWVEPRAAFERTRARSLLY
jgi:uncharacterized protein YbbC (DUF1343 family)